MFARSATPASRHARSRARPRAGVRAPARGFSLIVAMLMLAVIGLFSAAVMRNATSSDQVANNNRLQTQANQYAQLAMRWCQGQMALDSSSRAATVYASLTPPAWVDAKNWASGSGPHPAHTLTPKEIGGATLPRVAPQCLVEATSVPGVFTITARGFSSDFKADAGTGATRNGSVVWLQATVYADGADPAAAPGAAANGPLGVRERTWQQLLTPPF